MAQSINTAVYRGVSRQQIAEVLTPSLFLKSDQEIEGIRLTKEEHLRFLSPVLLANPPDERDEQREIQLGNYALQLQHQ